MLRVLLVSPMPPPIGGMSIWTKSLREELAKNDEIDVRMLDTALHHRSALHMPYWRRVVVGLKRLPAQASSLHRLLRAERPAVVHISTSGHLGHVRDLVFVSIVRRHAVPVVLHIHHGRIGLHDVAWWEWLALRRLASHVDAIVVLDEASELALADAMSAASVTRIPNFFDDTGLGVETTPSPNQPKSFLYLGWVIPSKGILDLLAAWQQAGLEGWSLVIAGPADRDFAARLEPVVQGLTDVQFTGPLSHADAMNHLQQCSAFVFPTHTEGFPLAVLEAMSLSKPVIASSVGGLPQLVGDAGVLVPPRRPDVLADRMVEIANSESLRCALGDAARARAVDRYSSGKVVPRIITLWKTLSADT